MAKKKLNITLKLITLLLQITKAILGIAVLLLLYQAFGESIAEEWKTSQEVKSTRNVPQWSPPEEDDRIENGIHVATGLAIAPGFDLVRSNCTSCHSAKLITQNRATREGWAIMIDWMQEKQGLWELGEKEPIILDYLAANYAPTQVGRRANIDVEAVEWYILELE